MQAITRKQLTSGLGRSLVARPASVIPARAVSTEAMDSRQAMDLLNEQRAKRPSSPWHIYQPQLTSMSSIANRATGAGLSVAFYAVFLGHVMAPAFGTTLDSAALVDMFAALPGWFATSLKGAVAAAGSYHTLNGLRHLSWDMGYLLDLKTSYMAGYVVLGATALSTAAILAL
ncbi:cytochrome b560 subunit of succinate dehydrogenase [Rhodotorula sp. JG-1b]|nr:cytochrome b560 subunit of succinate dehydrogenase [Rhodotorula sp. JG-1b]